MMGRIIKYCPICEEPIQKEYDVPSFLGGKRIETVQCACQRAETREKEIMYKRREHENMVSRNTKICFRQKKMSMCTFENDNGKTAAMPRAKRYVEKWRTVKSENIGLLLWGGIGSGKTYMAACIANALLEQEKKVLMTDFTAISNLSMYDVSEYIRSIETYDLLIIDDLGAERGSEFALQNVYDVINSRYNSGKPLIVTTNLSLQEIKAESNVVKARIYDRILGMCVPVFVDGDSKRIEEGSNKKEILKEMLQVDAGGDK